MKTFNREQEQTDLETLILTLQGRKVHLNRKMDSRYTDLNQVMETAFSFLDFFREFIHDPLYKVLRAFFSHVDICLLTRQSDQKVLTPVPNEPKYQELITHLETLWNPVETERYIYKLIETDDEDFPKTLLTYCSSGNKSSRYLCVRFKQRSKRIYSPNFIKMLCYQLRDFVLVQLPLRDRFILHQKMIRLNLKIDEEKDKLKFLSMVSAALVDPLKDIKRNLEDLLHRIYGPLQPKQEEKIKGCLEYVAKENNLVSDLLEIQQQKLNYTHESLSELCRTSASHQKPKAASRGIDLLLELPENDVEILVDKKKIHSILRHLISNAIKFTDRGKITISLNTVGNDCIICIHDTGIGIPRDEINNIFKFMYQANKPHGRQFRGAGVGLHIVETFTKWQCGEIQVTSKIGLGSTFTLKIPKNVDSDLLPLDS